MSIVIKTSIALGTMVYSATYNTVGKIRFNKKKVKKGLKDGSIVEIDGKFYEIDSVVEEA